MMTKFIDIYASPGPDICFYQRPLDRIFSSAASVFMLIKVWMLMKRYKGVYSKLHFRLKRSRYTVSWYYSPPYIPNRYGLHICIFKMPNDCLYGSKINVIKLYHVVVILKLKSDGKIECLSKICHLCDYHETSLELIWCQGICNHRHDVGRAVPHKFGGLLIILHTKQMICFWASNFRVWSVGQRPVEFFVIDGFVFPR